MVERTLVDGGTLQHPPEDFPWPNSLAAVPGAAPKLLLQKTTEGRYTSKMSSDDRLARWEYYEDLARQFATAALASKRGKRAHFSEVEILEHYLPRLIEKKWTSSAEAKWVLRKAAHLLNWPSPSEL